MARPYQRKDGGFEAFGEALLSRLRIPDDVPDLGDPEAVARYRLAEFCQYMDPTYLVPRHIKALTDVLERVERGELGKVLIMMPPQSGKSRTTSQLFPAWAIGRNPRLRIISASYGASLAERNSRYSRSLFLDPRWPFQNVKLDRSIIGVGHWQTMEGGYYHATGIGGPTTGFSADILLIDDPFKDREDADSEPIRTARWEWYQDVARTRMPKAIIVLNTRWHEDDLTGRILNSPDAPNWEQVIFREWAEEDDPLGREIGEVLWPERFPASMLPSVELGEIDVRTREALYQQRPAPRSGNMFQREWWQRYDERTLELRGLRPTLTTVDSSEGEASSDFSVAATWGWFEGRAYLMDLFRARITFPDLCQVLRDIYAKHKTPIYIESASSGKSLVQALARPLPATTDRPAQPPIPVIAEKVSRKVGHTARIEQVTRYVAAGLVYLPSAAPWVQDFIEEHASFPGKFDDQVETTAIALKKFFAGVERQEPTPFSYNRTEVDTVSTSDARPKGKWIEEVKNLRKKAASDRMEQVLREQEERDLERQLRLQELVQARKDSLRQAKDLQPV